MKLDVGMYARTKDGEIIKIKYVENVYTSDDNIFIATVVYFGESFYVNSDDVKKASHNIIDLIEVGDYVNGYKVIDMQNLICFDSDEGKSLLGIEAFDDYWELVEITIKSIVTKEQFEQMEYKVGE